MWSGVTVPEPCETRLALGGLREGRTPVSAAAVAATAQECPPPLSHHAFTAVLMNPITRPVFVPILSLFADL